MPNTSSRSEKMLPNQLGVVQRPVLGRGSYFSRSMRPLHMLIFLLPIVTLYELGTLGVFGPVRDSLKAHEMLVRFFDIFGVVGLHLPALALVTMLVIQHALTRDPFKPSFVVWVKMVAESAFLTVPLVVLVMLLKHDGGLGMAAQATVVEPSQASQMMLALGASLYEEMLFRLVLITLIHFLISDVFGFSETKGFVIGLIVSSAAFAWHHDQMFLLDGSIDVRKGIFYFLAGMYFGLLFLMRGLGIAVGVHLFYDLLVLVILPSFEAEPS